MEEHDQESTEEQQKDEGEQQAEGSEKKDAEGHAVRGSWREGDSESDEDEGDEGDGKSEDHVYSDARLKREVSPIVGALERLRTL